MIFEAFVITMNVFVGLYLLWTFLIALKDMKCQREWDKEKATRICLNSKISKAELCEYYVMFCKRNNCKVEF